MKSRVVLGIIRSIITKACSTIGTTGTKPNLSRACRLHYYQGMRYTRYTRYTNPGLGLGKELGVVEHSVVADFDSVATCQAVDTAFVGRGEGKLDEVARVARGCAGVVVAELGVPHVAYANDFRKVDGEVNECGFVAVQNVDGVSAGSLLEILN